MVRGGDTLLAQSDIEGARNRYRQATEEDPDFSRGYSRLSFAMLFDPAEQPAAVEVARKGTEVQPQSAEAWAYLARALDWNGKFDEALEAAERAERLNSEDANVQSFLAEVLADLRMYDQALKAAERAVELDPTNAEAHRNLAYVYQFMARPEDALSQYELAYSLEPEFVHRLTSLAAHYLYVLDDEQTAQEWLEKAEDLAPEDYITLLFLARINSRRGDYEQAAGYCDRILFHTLAAPDGHNCMGGVYLDAGRYQEAETSRIAAIRADPDDETGYIGLGYVYYSQGACSEAAGAFQRAVEIHPRSGSNHSNLGFAYACLGEWDRAGREYELAIELEPYDGDHHILLGRMYLAKGELRKAERSFEDAIELDPDEDQYVAWLGRLYAAEGDLARSVAAYERAAQMNPNEASHDLAIGFAYLDSNTNLAEARQRFQRARDTYIQQGATVRELAQASYGIALTYLANDDCTGALPHLQETARLDQAVVAARDFLEQCRQVAGFEGATFPPELEQRGRYAGQNTLQAVVESLGAMGVDAEADYRIDESGQSMLVVAHVGHSAPGTTAFAQQQSLVTYAGSLVLARTAFPEVERLVVITLDDVGEITGVLSVPSRDAKLWELGVFSDAQFASLWQVLQP